MEVSMSSVLLDMLYFFFDCVVMFFSSQPGIYLWALILIFYLVGIFGRLLSLPSLVMDRSIPNFSRSRQGGKLLWKEPR